MNGASPTAWSRPPPWSAGWPEPPGRVIGPEVQRRIVVHSLDQARAAVRAAAALGRPVTLQSARGAAGDAGSAWWQALIEAAGAGTAILDCGDEAGTVLGALRIGLRHLRFTGPAATRERLAAIAVQTGATVEGDVPVTLLDLLDQRDPEAACREFLG
jgi:hypothetical protein